MRSRFPGPLEARLAAAYARCERLAREHYENFPVASRLLPAHMRPHVAALYAFARSADDFADEGQMPPEERLELLTDWESRLHRCVEIEDSDPADEIFLALGATIRACNLPVSLFEDLLSAFRQDITTHRYQTWESVLDYCRRSANPVGRLVLRIGGYQDSRLDASSDALCTALQLTNFWQDLAHDWKRGRLYVPLEEVDACRAGVADLTDSRITEAWRCVLGRVAARTRALFDTGRAVCDGVGGRLRYELRVTWLGGCRILDQLERQRYDMFSARPSLGAADVPPLLWGALTWSRT
jgi:hydroxysqualene synthase